MSIVITLLVAAHAQANPPSLEPDLGKGSIEFALADVIGLEPLGVIIGKGGQEVDRWAGTVCVESATLESSIIGTKSFSLSSSNVLGTHQHSSPVFLTPGESTDLLDATSSHFTVIRPTNSLDASSPLLGLAIKPDANCGAEEGDLVTILLERPLDFRPTRLSGPAAPPLTLSFALEPASNSSCQLVSADVELAEITSDSQGLLVDFNLAKTGATVMGTPSFIHGWESSILQECNNAARTGRNPQTRTGRNPQTP